MKSNQMNELTCAELKEAVDQGQGVILPIGATEQLSIYIDSFFAEGIALAVAKETNLTTAAIITYGWLGGSLINRVIGGNGYLLLQRCMILFPVRNTLRNNPMIERKLLELSRQLPLASGWD